MRISNLVSRFKTLVAVLVATLSNNVICCDCKETTSWLWHFDISVPSNRLLISVRWLLNTSVNWTRVGDYNIEDYQQINHRSFSLDNKDHQHWEGYIIELTNVLLLRFFTGKISCEVKKLKYLRNGTVLCCNSTHLTNIVVSQSSSL